MIAKALISNADNIIAAIDKYLAKADSDLEKTLKAEGFVEPKETVKTINTLEEEIADILQEQTEELLAVLTQAKEDNIDVEGLKERIEQFLEQDYIAADVETASMDMYETEVPKLADVYMRQSDGELVVENVRQRTADWFQEWSSRLGEITKITTHKQITSLTQKTIAEGSSIQELTRKIQEGGWRSEYYQARRFAVTETLRAHSVAHEEAIQQSPSCDRKEWRHTGGSKNKPRENHVDMDGQIVPKVTAALLRNQISFTLIGRDGTVYYPMYPRDPILPAGESINCHCIHRGIVNDDVLGMSYEERKKLQEEIIANDDAEWEKELDAKNKAKAGIKPDKNVSTERAISHTNTQAAQKWAKTHLGVKKTNYTNQDIKCVNKANRALQRIYKEYPELEGFVHEIRFSDKMPVTNVAVAKISKTKDSYRTQLLLNTDYFSDVKALNLFIKEQVSEGQWTSKRGIYGVIKHEMVHMLSYQYSLSAFDNVEDAWKDIMNAESKMCKDIKKKAFEACNLEDEYDIVRKNLSVVATKNADEFVAEAISSSKQSKLVKTVKEIFDSYVR